MVYVFLDTEFAPQPGARQPALLSIGLCTMSGDEFYRELASEYRLVYNDFLREHVLPQLEQPGASRSSVELSAELVDWLDGLGQAELQICYDYHLDFDLFEEFLQSAPRSTTELVPTHIGYLLEDADGESAAQACFAQLERERNIRRHHALADAIALRARFVAVHGR